MGCDIHLEVERRGDDGRWILVDRPSRPCGSCRGTGKNHPTPHARPEWSGHPCSSCHGTGITKPAFYENRRSTLFAVLAGVRTPFGHSDAFDPIAEPRGVPADASPEYRAYAADWGVNGHTHSYLTVAELNAVEWTRTAPVEGFVGPAVYADWVARGRKGVPSKYTPFVLTKALSNEEMDARIAAGEAARTDADGGPWTVITFHMTYAEAAGSFFTSTLPELNALAEQYGGPPNVRIVFFFDN